MVTRLWPNEIFKERLLKYPQSWRDSYSIRMCITMGLETWSFDMRWIVHVHGERCWFLSIRSFVFQAVAGCVNRTHWPEGKPEKSPLKKKLIFQGTFHQASFRRLALSMSQTSDWIGLTNLTTHSFPAPPLPHSNPHQKILLEEVRKRRWRLLRLVRFPPRNTARQSTLCGYTRNF